MSEIKLDGLILPRESSQARQTFSGDYFKINREQLINLFDNSQLMTGKSNIDLQRQGGAEGLLRALVSHRINGINNDPFEIEQRIKNYGENVIQNEESQSFYYFLCVALNDFCIRILIICAFLLFFIAIFGKNMGQAMLQCLSLIFAISFVIFIQAITDYRKVRQFEELYTRLVEQQNNAYRAGQQVILKESEVLVGDIIEIEAGKYLEVDGILISGEIEIDESSLTGKSGTIQKQMQHSGASYDESSSPGRESTTMNIFLRSGSVVIDGKGMMLVLCVGKYSLIGQMKIEISTHDESSLLANSLKELAKFLIKIGAGFSMVMFVILMYYCYVQYEEKFEQLASLQGVRVIIGEFIESFLIVVLSVPEGLPVIMTLGLSFAVSKLKEQGVIVRNLNSVTQIGGTDVLIFDKTGTLTKNELSVCSLHYQLNEARIDVWKYNPDYIQILLHGEFSQELRQFIQKLCQIQEDIYVEPDVNSENDNDYVSQEMNSEVSHMRETLVLHSPLKDPTHMDTALIEFYQTLPKLKQSEEFEDHVLQFRKQNYRGFLIRIPTLNHEEDKYKIILKSRAKSILDQCTRLFSNLDYVITKSDRKYLEEDVIHQMEHDSMRVTCLVMQQIIIKNGDIEKFSIEQHLHDMILLAVIGFKDEPREEAKKVMKLCSKSGIRVMMMTGDSKGTAQNIAQQLELITPDEAADSEDNQNIISSDRFLNDINLSKQHEGNPEDISKENLQIFNDRLTKLKIMYDASAQDQKLIVKGLMNLGHVVGYVGDGNNDAYALSQSNIGFCMGTTGTDIAKYSSNIVLEDDELKAIISFIIWGRHVYFNIERFIYFQLTFFLTTAIIMIIASVTLQESPYSVLQIIWLCLIHDIISSLALCTEKPRSRRTDQDLGRPFKKNQNLLNPYLYQLMIVQGCYQIFAIIFLLFTIPKFFDIQSSDQFGINDIDNVFNPIHAIHYTMIFHITGLFQIFNLINTRRIQPYQYNQFQGLLQNPAFIFLLLLTYCIQTSLMYFGDHIMKTSPLSFTQNLFCHLVAFGSFIFFWIAKSMISNDSEEDSTLSTSNPIQASNRDENQKLQTN